MRGRPIANATGALGPAGIGRVRLCLAAALLGLAVGVLRRGQRADAAHARVLSLLGVLLRLLLELGEVVRGRLRLVAQRLVRRLQVLLVDSVRKKLEKLVPTCFSAGRIFRVP